MSERAYRDRAGGKVTAHSKASQPSARQPSPDGSGPTDLASRTRLTGRTELTDLTVDAAPALNRAEPSRLERTVAWTLGERLRCLWYRLRIEISDYHYVARRVVELRLRLPQ
jgi:hypothetical protein